MTFPENENCPRAGETAEGADKALGGAVSILNDTRPSDHKTTVPFADALRGLADFVDAHPQDFEDVDECLSLRHLIYCRDRGELAAVIRRLGGRWQKDTPSGDDLYFGATLHLPAGFRVYAYTSRSNVCERVQVGVTKVMVPAEQQPDLPPVQMVEVEKPVYEYRCPDSI